MYKSEEMAMFTLSSVDFTVAEVLLVLSAVFHIMWKCWNSCWPTGRFMLQSQLT